VSIDVDDATVDLLSFISTCTLKPTFAYETFSNGVMGQYRYRLVYIISEPLNSKAYVQMYDKICLMTHLEATKDHCGKLTSQLMNGTNHSAYVFRSDIIYSSITDIPVDATFEDQKEFFKDSLIPVVDPVEDFNKEIKNKFDAASKSIFNNNNINNISHNNQKQYKSNDPKWNSCIGNFKHEIEMLEQDIDDFLKYHHQFLKLIRFSKLEYNESGYCVIPEDHLSLFVRYKSMKGECMVDRFRDGEKRRNRLYIDGCIIRKIKPDINYLELLYNLAHRVRYYYDNSDGVLSAMLIARKAFDVMSADVDSMEFKSLDAGRVTTSKGYCALHNVSRRSWSRKALMLENYSSIQEWYDPEESVGVNLKRAKEKGVKVSLSTLKRYCKMN